jgi:murein DD-endopeptidase MepM/ murein hydrolase activator NlpD
MNTRVHFVVQIVFIFALMVLPFFLNAQTAVELQNEIEKSSAEIENLEREIVEYEKQLDQVATEKRTLESNVRELDITRKKVSANVSVAQTRVNSTELEITEIDREISAREKEILSSTGALSETIRRINMGESQTLVETILKSEKVSVFWDEVGSIEQFQTVLKDRLITLDIAKKELISARGESERKFGQLVIERDDLSSQKQALDITRREKNYLLSNTKEKESTYQEILEEKRKAKEEFEAAILELESKLEYTRDPSRIPPAGQGILRWPLDAIKITQNFGTTAFSQSGAYNGKGHNGVDFRASVGTPVKSALSGVVQATGNTDQYAGCYSYGKWVLVKHNNGLSTLYAHLSHIAANSGAQVSTGQVIGYSGNTGYSTGPHLHFTVYESSGVQLVKLGDVRRKTNCANATIPVAPLPAYLNPTDYL